MRNSIFTSIQHQISHHRQFVSTSFFPFFSSQSNPRIDKKKYLKQGMVPPQHRPHPQTTLFLKRERVRFVYMQFHFVLFACSLARFVSDRYIFIVCCALVSSRWLTFRVECIQSVEFRIVVSEQLQHLLCGFFDFIHSNQTGDSAITNHRRVVTSRRRQQAVENIRN